MVQPLTTTVGPLGYDDLAFDRERSTFDLIFKAQLKGHVIIPFCLLQGSYLRGISHPVYSVSIALVGYCADY